VEAQPQRISHAHREPMRCAFAPRILRSRAENGALGLFPHQPAPVARATKEPTNQQTKKRSASCYRLPVGADDALRLRLHTSYGCLLEMPP